MSDDYTDALKAAEAANAARGDTEAARRAAEKAASSREAEEAKRTGTKFFRLLGVAAAALGLTATLAACGREVDLQVTDAQPVPGTSNLYRFCDGPTLIYFTKQSGNDEYDWYWPGGCVPTKGGGWTFGNLPPSGDVPPGDSTEDK